MIKEEEEPLVDSSDYIENSELYNSTAYGLKKKKKENVAEKDIGIGKLLTPEEFDPIFWKYRDIPKSERFLDVEDIEQLLENEKMLFCEEDYDKRENTIKLQVVKIAFNKYFEISDEDQEVIDIFLAVLGSNRLKGDPVWLYIVGPSGYLKTTLCRSSKKVSDVYFLDTLTDKTLVSGLTKKDEKTKKDVPKAGILQHLDGKVLVIKDLSALLSMKDYKRDSVLSQLRNAYDGYYDAAFGTLPEPIRLKAEFGFIGAVTPIIDRHTKAMVTLGPRCLIVRTKNPPRQESAKMARKNKRVTQEIRERIQDLVRDFIDDVNFNRRIEISEEMGDRIDALADYTAYMRTYVMADYYGGNIVEYTLPSPEVPTRLSIQLSKLGEAIALIRGHNEITEEDYATLMRVAKDTAIPEYQHVMNYYLDEGNANKRHDVNEISSYINLTYKTTRNKLELMRIIGILDNIGGEHIPSDEFTEILFKAKFVSRPEETNSNDGEAQK